MLSFESDYICGAHPEILRRLAETNLEPLSGYGADRYCESARQKIREACGCPDAEVEFLSGGTQANAVVISTMLKDFEGVIAAKTGHVALHEAGAIEYTGHKVLELPENTGKIAPDALRAYLENFYADGNHEHMVFPGMVYITYPTEYGTLYTKNEMTGIAEICREYRIPLYLDGARLGYGLMSEEADLTLPEIASLCDVFYIGGTKVGALCGETVVFTKKNRPPHFVTQMKRRGALSAKGRLYGVQFDTLFSPCRKENTQDNAPDEILYYQISRHAIEMAGKMKRILLDAGLPLYLDSPTNQQFPILENAFMERLSGKTAFSFWEKYDETHTVVRFAASWSTSREDIDALAEILRAL